MKTPVVSVTMPVYNAEKTVEKAIWSFQMQSLADWELIAVNDGSTDRSLEILHELASKDPRIVVIDKTNGGVASARQAGVEKISGKYVIHADSDDWVEPEMLQRMVEKAEESGAEMVIADYFIDKPHAESKRISQRITSLDSKDVLYAIYAKELLGGLCHKLMQASVYDKAQAKFLPGIDFCEDVLLLTQILSKLDLKIEYLPEAFYHYVMTESSLTRNFSRKGFEQMKRFNAVFPSMLPNEPRFKVFSKRTNLDTFVMGFVNNVYTHQEIKTEFAKVKKDAYSSCGLRWRIGYNLIELGLYSVAHLFIKF